MARQRGRAVWLFRWLKRQRGKGGRGYCMARGRLLVCPSDHCYLVMPLFHVHGLMAGKGKGRCMALFASLPVVHCI